MATDAAAHFEAGTLANLREDWDTAIREYESALTAGLPREEEMQLRMFLSECYFHLAQKALIAPHPDVLAILRGPAFRSSESNVEAAVAMDREGGFGYFADSTNRARLDKVDWGYGLAAMELKEATGREAAIKFLEAKRAMFSFFPSTPLITATHVLADLYKEAGRKDEARHCWVEIVQAALVCDSAGEMSSRATASEMLNAPKEGKVGGGCFVATAVYGAPDADEVVLFRRFRDDVLVRSKIGRGVVGLYYIVGPQAARVVRWSPTAHRFTRRLLDKVARILARRRGL